MATVRFDREKMQAEIKYLRSDARDATLRIRTCPDRDIDHWASTGTNLTREADALQAQFDELDALDTRIRGIILEMVAPGALSDEVRKEATK